MAPSWGAVNGTKLPPNRPMGVRTALTMTGFPVTVATSHLGFRCTASAYYMLSPLWMLKNCVIQGLMSPVRRATVRTSVNLSDLTSLSYHLSSHWPEYLDSGRVLIPWWYLPLLYQSA